MTHEIVMVGGPFAGKIYREGFFPYLDVIGDDIIPIPELIQEHFLKMPPYYMLTCFYYPSGLQGWVYEYCINLLPNKIPSHLSYITEMPPITFQDEFYDDEKP